MTLHKSCQYADFVFNEDLLVFSMLKIVLLLNIFVETKIPLFQDSQKNTKLVELYLKPSCIMHYKGLLKAIMYYNYL